MEFAPVELVVRCYAKKERDKWQAFCVDLCLVAQADTFEAAQKKLESIIVSYVYDAVAGVDKEHAAYLLSRKAPLVYRLKYYAYVGLAKMGAFKDGMRRSFAEVIPLAPPLQHI